MNDGPKFSVYGKRTHYDGETTTYLCEWPYTFLRVQSFALGRAAETSIIKIRHIKIAAKSGGTFLVWTPRQGKRRSVPMDELHVTQEYP